MPERSPLARVAAIVVALWLAAACGSSGADPAATTVGGSFSATTSTTTIPITPAGGTYGVGRADIVLVDESRDTDADPDNDIPAQEGRTLETVVLYPTEDPDADGSDDSQPVAEGRFPLLVFSHGVTASGPVYAGIVDDIVTAGYVVALPTFPLTAGPTGWDNIDQTTNQPADVSFVISELLERSESGDDLLADRLSPHAVAVGGHSLGSITSVLFYNTCCLDDRVKAVVGLSGIMFPGPEPTDTYSNAPSQVPLLLLHGTDDGTLAYEGGSLKTYQTLDGLPRALVTFPDVGHSDILVSPSMIPSVVAFLDLTLRQSLSGWEALEETLEDNGDATIEVAGGLPVPVG